MLSHPAQEFFISIAPLDFGTTNVSGDRLARIQAGGTVLTPAELAHMQREGFLRLETFVSTEEVAEIRSVLETLFQKKAGYKEGAYFNFAGPEEAGAPTLPQILGPHNFASSLRKTQFFKNASALAVEILGPEARFGNDHTLMKPALDGPATPWHQDEAFRQPEYDYHEISVWMPLQDVNEVNGCMEFMPGTHLRDVLPHQSPNDDPRIHVLECREGFDLADRAVCPLPAGGCTVHTGRTLHGAGPNLSPHPRYAYVLNFAVPPVPATKPRHFPWLEGKNTAGGQRQKGWLRRGGIFVETWRLLRHTERRDYGKLVSNLRRKAGKLFSLLRR